MLRSDRLRLHLQHLEGDGGLAEHAVRWQRLLVVGLTVSAFLQVAEAMLFD